MKIEYIWVKNYKNILKNLNINFGGENIYTYEEKNNILNFKYNELYLKNFFSKYMVIEQINSIIGENGVGKTTVLRLINEIFSNKESKSEYIIIYTYNKKLYMYNNCGDQVNIKNKNIILIKNKNNNLIRDSGHVVNIIYFSSVFDKARKLEEHINLFDISTNKLIRNFIQNSELEGKYFDLEVIDEFRKKEIPQTLRLFSDIKSNKKDIELLFNIPDKVYMEINDTAIKYKNMLKDLTSLLEKKEDIDEFIANIYNIRDKIITKIDMVDIKSVYIGLGIFQIFLGIIYTSAVRYNYPIEKILYRVNLILNEYKNSIDEKIKKQNIDLDVIMDRCIGILLTYSKNIINNNIFRIRSNIGIGSWLEDLNLKVDKLLINIEEESFFQTFDIQEYRNEIEEILVLEKEIDLELQRLKREKLNNTNRFLNKEIEENNYDTNLKRRYSNNYYIFSSIVELESIDNYNEEDIYYMFHKIKDEIIEAKNSINTINEVRDDEDRNEYNDNYTNLKLFKGFIDDSRMMIKYFKKIVHNSTIEKDKNNVRLEINTIDKYFDSFLKYDIKLNFYQENFKFDWYDLSSGQNSYIDMISRLFSLRSDSMYQHTKSNENIIFLIDEGELYLHPNAQIKFIDNLCNFINELFPQKYVHIINTSNSPFTISDLPNLNVIYMHNNDVIRFENNLTFGANIHLLLSDSFYMKDGTIGSFARDKITKLSDNLMLDNSIFQQKLKSGEFDLNDFEKTIRIIGEPVIRRKLEQLYNEKRKYINKVCNSSNVSNLLIKFEKLNIGEKQEFIKEIIRVIDK